MQGKDGNIRALLASLDTVLWEGSGWKKPSMTDLVEPKRVKRAYMMANLVVHPDKVKQKGGTVGADCGGRHRIRYLEVCLG